MSLPGNGIFVVQGEMAMLVTAMRRSSRWGSHTFPTEEYDVLMRTFQELKTILNQVDDLRLLDPATYLSPFLEVIRSRETSGPVTSLALSSIHKFLSYGLIDPTHPSVPATVEDIADAVTHARFVGTDHSSDGVVLMKILQVLRTLMLSPEGALLTDESVCEIMLSCFRICFETRLSELLRRNAEQCLRDMTQLIFMRLPQFPPEDATAALTSLGLSLKKREKAGKKKGLPAGTNLPERKSPVSEAASPTDDKSCKIESLKNSQDKNLINEAEITIEPVRESEKTDKNHTRHSSMDIKNSHSSISQLLEKCVADSREGSGQDQDETENTEEKSEEPAAKEEENIEPIETDGSTCTKPADSEEKSEKLEEYVNHRGIRFTQQEETVNLQPYGLTCVRELLRFVISLCNPLDAQNTSAMVHLGLCLLGTALEVAADQLPLYPSLLHLVKDSLCRNLLSLLNTERISIFALDLQVSFLLFEALRFHLKYQMEAFFKKIIELLSADTSKAINELKEIQELALESLAQVFRIPGLCAELYLNYDCDIYCMNVFEEVTKLLSKNVVSTTTPEIHKLSLEVLLTIIEAIEVGSQSKEGKSEEILSVEVEKETDYGRGGHITLELGGMDDSSVVSDHVTHDISHYFGIGKTGRHKPSTDLPTEAELDNIRNLKKWVTQGTELFNQKPERGIEYLQEHGVLITPLDPHQVAIFLRENPDLDKKMIGEYICKRSSREEEEGQASVLGAFADSFDFAALRIDLALRLYLESFRLPGEAPLIFLVMERFAERWHSTNGEPFANTDAAFRLAYAVIMLNMDQHNHNAKKLNIPMTVEDFVKNLRGCNGNGDFDQAMLEQIYYSIKNEEMVMPAERVGEVREAYLWRVLQRRSATPSARYVAVPRAHPHVARLFTVACPPAVTALSAAFERAPAPTQEDIESPSRHNAALLALAALERVAALTARLPADTINVDTLLLTLCKFTGLQTLQNNYHIAIGVSLGQSSKATLALRRACAVAQRHADCVRQAWRHLLEILKILYLGRLLPKCLMEADDYLAPEGKVPLIREASRPTTDAGLLSSIYSYIALGETGIRTPTPHEKVFITAATECVAKCNLPALLITETKFLQLESLKELVRAMIVLGTPPDAESLQLNPQLEDITIFFLELLGQTLVQNRDRVLSVWEEAGSHLERVVVWASSVSSAQNPYCVTRCVTCVLRSSALLMRCELCAPAVLHHLQLLLRLRHPQFHQLSNVIVSGLFELIKTSAQNIHSLAEWEVVFTLLCAAGGGAWPASLASANSTASSRSEGSEEESDRRPTSVSSESELSHSPQTQGWILVKNESQPANLLSLDLSALVFRRVVPGALCRACEALALVVRDVAHVTPHNCRAAVRALRILAHQARPRDKKSKTREGRNSRPSSARRAAADSDDEDKDTQDQLHMVSLQLLDLMHTLHSRTAQIFKWWRDESDQGGEDYDLWEISWKPLLQGIAQFCTDKRKRVVNSAITYLQRALLAPGMAGMGAECWEACFHCVLFPLLEPCRLSPEVAPYANAIMCKVFLHHLSALWARATFSTLWLRIVALQLAFTATGADDTLHEAARETLKNMILVMHSVKIFSNGDTYNDLWYITWEKIGEVLPSLKDELFPEAKEVKPQNLPSHLQPSLPPTLPTLVPVGPQSSTPSILPTNSIPIPTTPQSTEIQPSSPQMYQNTLVQSTYNFIQPNNMVRIQTSQPTNILAQTLPQSTPTQSGIPSPVSEQSQITTQMTSAIPNQYNILTRTQTEINQILSIPSSVQPYNVNPVLIQSNAESQSANLTSTYSIGRLNQSLAQSPVNLGQSSPPNLVAPIPVSGMVPIRNPLYEQGGLASSVLLQPLNEMVSTQIGISIQSQMPVLYPRPTESQAQIQSEVVNKIEPKDPVAEFKSQNTVLSGSVENIKHLEQGELYAEYLTNPYHDTKEISAKEVTLYNPEENRVEDQNGMSHITIERKALSANTTPMHRNKAQFGSTDNLKQESSIFNFSSYFGAVNETISPGSEVFDTLMTSQDG